MHIARLALDDVPPFYVAYTDFDEKVNVFIGPNASGKSTILRAMEYIYFPQEDHPLSYITVPDSTWNDERFENWSNDTGLEDSLCVMEASRDWPLNDPDPMHLIHRIKGYQAPIWSKVPLLYIPATRVNLPVKPVNWLEGGWPEERLSRSVSRSVGYIGPNSAEPSFPRSFDIFGDADPTVFNGQHVKTVSDMLLQENRGSLQGRDWLHRTLNVGHSCARSICPEVIDDYEVHPYIDEANVAHPNMGIGANDGLSLYLGDLSSGTQGTLLWIWALCLKMARHYRWKHGWEKEPAILLIDEIENHLHPTWQRRVIPALLKHFPGLQIFATTHSPFVVAGLKAGQVHLVKGESGFEIGFENVISTNTEDIIGWTVDEILRTFMGVDDPTDELTATNAERLRVLRRKDALEGLDDREQAELDELRTRVGADILAQGGFLNAERERFAAMVQEFLKARLADVPQDEEQA